MDQLEDVVSNSEDREPEKKPTSVNDLVAAVAARLRPRAEEKGSKIVFDPGEFVGDVELDASGIDRVLTNLVENALDAVADAAGGRVTVRTAPAPPPNRVEIVVSDTGPGIPPGDRERTFELANARKILVGHGGRIDVDSESGRGATFRVTV